jgi:hypothetical protein
VDRGRRSPPSARRENGGRASSSARDLRARPRIWITASRVQRLRPRIRMRRLFPLVLPLALTACPAGGINVSDHAAKTEGDDVALAVTVTSLDVDVWDYCLDVDWKDAAGNVIERHRQCDSDLEESSHVTHGFRLFGRTCVSYEVSSDVAAHNPIAAGDCPKP